MTDKYAKLRELAEKATPGDWTFQFTNEVGGEVFIFAGNLGGIVAAALPWPTEIDSRDYTRVLANGRYIAAANPQTVLELLDHLAAEKATADAAEANCERWRLTSIANHEAFAAMRNAINEVVPMQSAEADLLQGPEQSVACEAIASAVVATISTLTAERDALKRERDEARAALEPFSAVAKHDIGEDETDEELFRPMNAHNRAPRITVGDLRRARNAHDGEGY